MALGHVGHLVAAIEPAGVETRQRRHLAFKAVLFGAVKAGGGLACRPGAVKKAHQPVGEHIGKGDEGGVAFIAPPVAGIFGQVQRQGALRAEQTKAAVGQPHLARFIGRKLGDGRRRERQFRLLPQPDRVLR